MATNAMNGFEIYADVISEDIKKAGDKFLENGKNLLNKTTDTGKDVLEKSSEFAKNQLSKATNLLKDPPSIKKAIELNDETMRGIGNTVNQLSSLEDILKENYDLIKGGLKSDDDISFLDSIKDGSAGIGDLQQRVLQGEDVSRMDLEDVVSKLEDMKRIASNNDLALETNLKSLLDVNMQRLDNDNLSMEERRQSLTTLQDLLNTNRDQLNLSDTQAESLDQLLGVNAKLENFSEKTLSSITGLMNDLGDDTRNIKMLDTMRSIEDSLGDTSLTLDRIQDEFGESKSGGLGEKAKGMMDGKGGGLMKSGIAALLSQFGLGNLIPLLDEFNLDISDMILSGVGGSSLLGLGKGKDRGNGGDGNVDVGKGKDKGKRGKSSKVSRKGGKRGILGKAKGVLSRLNPFGDKGGKGGESILKKVSSIPSKALDKSSGFISKGMKLLNKVGGKLTKILKPILKVGGKLLGKLALPIAIVMSIFDFFDGFTNAAEISGISPEKLTLLDKAMAGISTLVSGLTLGFVDAETIFEKIKGGFDYFFGEEGIYTKIGDHLQDIFSGGDILKNLSGIADVFLDHTKLLLTKIFDLISQPIKSLASTFGLDKFFSSDDETKKTDKKEEGGFFSRFFGGSKGELKKEPETKTRADRIVSMTKKRQEEAAKDRVEMRKSMNNKQPIVVTTGEGGKSKTTVDRSSRLDDLSTELLLVGGVD